jgi:hypothetical protein
LGGWGTREKRFFLYYRREDNVKILETVVQIHVNHILNIHVENVWKNYFSALVGLEKRFPALHIEN